ncbi:MAG: hypothetical protein LBR85_00750 [Oscillospiraceae bacterium]|jgi:hypothetical protein|nr:hypothetical protein [Oscillospiraceae bacterium]
MRKKISLGVVWSLVIVMLLGTAAMAAGDWLYSPITYWTSGMDYISTFASQARIRHEGGSTVKVEGTINITGSTSLSHMGVECFMFDLANSLIYSSGEWWTSGNDDVKTVALLVDGLSAGTYRGYANTGVYINGESEYRMTSNTPNLVFRPSVIVSKEVFYATAEEISPPSMPAQSGISVNENGQTYGPQPLDPNVEPPELIAAVGIDGTRGYVYSKDIKDHEPFTSEEDIAAYTEKQHKLRKEAQKNGGAFLSYVPLYASDGVTVIGEFGWGAADSISYSCGLDADGNKVYTDYEGNVLELDADGNPYYVSTDGNVRVLSPLQIGEELSVSFVNYPPLCGE